MIEPVIVDPKEVPVREIVEEGECVANLQVLPALRQQ